VAWKAAEYIYSVQTESVESLNGCRMESVNKDWNFWHIHKIVKSNY